MNIYSILSRAILQPKILKLFEKMKIELEKINSDERIKKIIFEKYPEFKNVLEEILEILNS